MHVNNIDLKSLSLSKDAAFRWQRIHLRMAEDHE